MRMHNSFRYPKLQAPCRYAEDDTAKLPVPRIVELQGSDRT